MKLIKRNITFLLIFVLIFGIWLGNRFSGKISQYYSNFTSFFSTKEKDKDPGPENTKNNSSNAENKYPSDFNATGVKELKLDITNDGKEEVLLTSLSASGPQAVLVDSGNKTKKLSNIFDFSTKGFSEDYFFNSEEAPEVYQAIDLNKNGSKELIFDLKDYGVYTSSYGIVSVSGGKMSWVMLEEKGGTMRPAIFRDGASVRNANIFKIEEGATRAISEVLGVSDNEGNWTWEASAFSWNGSKYVYNADLSAQILKKQPKKIIDGQPVF